MTYGEQVTNVVVETILEAHYVMPDVPIAAIELVLRQVNQVDEHAQLILHNVSGAVLVMPWRIVRLITCDGGERWKRRPSNA